MSQTYDCQKCGACCFGLDVLLSFGEADDFAANPRLAGLIVEHPRTSAPALTFMRRDAQTDCCVALAGGLLDCRCTIYADRPSLCREFEAGSEPCLASRRKKGLPD